MSEIDGGWIVLARQLRDSRLWRSATLAQRGVIVEIFLAANWKTTWGRCAGKPREIPRGALLISERTLAESCKCSRKTIRGAIELMVLCETVKTEIWAQQGAQYSRLITILNYDKYQVLDNYMGPGRGTTKGTTKGATEGTTKGSDQKEGKERKEGKEDLGLALPLELTPQEPARALTEYQRVVAEYFRLWELKRGGKPPWHDQAEAAREGKSIKRCLEVYRGADGAIDAIRNMLCHPFHGKPGGATIHDVANNPGKWAGNEAKAGMLQ